MKIFKTAVLAALMVSGVAVGAHAAPTAIALTGEVAPISTYSFTPNAFLLTYDMTASSQNVDLTVGALTIDNNDPDGFTVSISSANSGRLKRYDTAGAGSYIVGSNPGDSTAYTVKFVANSVPGTVGATLPAGFANASIDLATAQDFDFSSPTQATVAAKYDLKVTAVANTALFNTSDTATEVYRD